jgi:hypothetical protein
MKVYKVKYYEEEDRWVLCSAVRPEHDLPLLTIARWDATYGIAQGWHPTEDAALADAARVIQELTRRVNAARVTLHVAQRSFVPFLRSERKRRVEEG